MAPPRLPQIFRDRLIPILAAVPDVAAPDMGRRYAFLERVRWPADVLDGLDRQTPAQEVAERLLGHAAHLVTQHNGPGQGRMALGDLLAGLLAEPALASNDKEWIAALIIRYSLIARNPPDPLIPPATHARLARVPPQPPPYWDWHDWGAPLAPTTRRVGQYQAVQAAAAAGEWERVLEFAGYISSEFAIPELADEARQDLAASGIRLPELAAQAQAALVDRAARIASVGAAAAAGQWAEALHRARTWGPDPPPEVAAAVAATWQALPIPGEVLGGGRGPVHSVAITPDSRQAISTGFDGTLTLWDLAGGAAVRTFTPPPHPAGVVMPVEAVAVLPNGRHALAGGTDGTLTLWDLSTGQVVRTLAGPWRAVRGVVVTADGQQALVWSEDSVFALWDLATGQVLRRFAGHRADVSALMLLPGEGEILSGGRDKQLKLWDRATGRELRGFAGPGGVIEALAALPGGQGASRAARRGTWLPARRGAPSSCRRGRWAPWP